MLLYNLTELSMSVAYVKWAFVAVMSFLILSDMISFQLTSFQMNWMAACALWSNPVRSRSWCRLIGCSHVNVSYEGEMKWDDFIGCERDDTWRHVALYGVTDAIHRIRCERTSGLTLYISLCTLVSCLQITVVCFGWIQCLDYWLCPQTVGLQYTQKNIINSSKITLNSS